MSEPAFLRYSISLKRYDNCRLVIKLISRAIFKIFGSQSERNSRNAKKPEQALVYETSVSKSLSVNNSNGKTVTFGIFGATPMKKIE